MNELHGDGGFIYGGGGPCGVFYCRRHYDWTFFFEPLIFTSCLVRCEKVEGFAMIFLHCKAFLSEEYCQPGMHAI